MAFEGEDFDPQGGKPSLALRLISGGEVKVGWKKGNYESIEIEVDRGTGWTFLAIDTHPDYTDTHSAPATPALWKYRAIYRLDDARVGSWSDIAQLTVGGS